MTPRPIAQTVPLLATLLVLAAVGTMIWLGVWQLQRRAWKESLLARYATAGSITEAVPFPQGRAAVEIALYRRSSVDCLEITARGAAAGRSRNDQPGWAVTATCRTASGSADVVLGWSASPAGSDWSGGRITGVLGPGANGTARLFADPPLGGLAPLARPDPRGIPNNHLAYAVQWFLFAGVALVIYAIALRKRLRAG